MNGERQWLSRSGSTSNRTEINGWLTVHQKEKNVMERYLCSVCGYVYDPAEGDSDAGIKKGVAFADLPDDWVCPVCGAAKDQFVPE